MPSTPDPLEAFDKVLEEETPIVKTIKGERFEFPGAVPADIALDFFATVVEQPDIDLTMLAIFEFSQMVGDEEVKRLTGLGISFPAIRTLVVALFQHYGLLSKEEAKAPNRQARRPSKKASSKGSARSARDSDASTPSTSPQPSKV